MASADDQPTVYSTPATWRESLAARYDDIREIGRGGMGLVFRARDRQTGDTVALKLLRPELVADGEHVARFKSELRLARRITHKNVCRVYDLTELGPVTAISMEFVEGDTLRALLARVESLSVRFGLKVLRQILAGMREAHEQGVIHRDLKPENIVVAAGGAVKIMDFGIARAADGDPAQTAVLIGTPAYMSPEQLAGSAADVRSDIYALGLVMHEMFCGGLPGGGAAASMPAGQGSEWPNPRAIEPSLPALLERVILTCLERDPTKRFQSVGELEAALDADVRREQAPVDPETIPDALLRWQRHDWTLAGAALMAVALFFAIVEAAGVAPRAAPAFDRGALGRIVHEHARALDVVLEGEPQYGVGWYGAVYYYLVRQAPFPEIRALLGAEVPLYTWRVRYPSGPFFEIDTRGRLVAFNRGGTASDAAVALDAARATAAAAATQFFGVQPQTLQIERDGTLGPQAHFTWVDPQPPFGLVHRYQVWVESRGVVRLADEYTVPAGVRFTWEPYLGNWYGPVSIVLASMLLVVTFRQRQRVDLTTRWRLALAAVAVLAAIGAALRVPAAERHAQWWLNTVAMAVFAGGAWLVASIAIEVQARKIGPGKLSSLTSLFDRPLKSPAAGLAIVRGSLVAAVLMGLDAMLTWAATTHLGAWYEEGVLWTLGTALGVSPSLVPLVVAVTQMFWVGIFVVVAAALLGGHSSQRLSRRLLLPAAALMAVGAHLSMAAIQPWYWTAVVLAVEYTLLVWAVTRYDVLTLFWCIFSATFVLGIWSIMIALRQAGDAAPAAALIGWALVVAAAARVAFAVQIDAISQRVTRAFD